MIFWISGLLVSWFDFTPATAAKWGKRIFVGLIVLAVLAIGLLYFSCIRGENKPQVIKEETLQKTKTADRQELQKEFQKVVDDNSEVVRTVDNRSTIAEVNAIERNRIADDKARQAADAVIAARIQGRDVTAEELECLLTGNLCK